MTIRLLAWLLSRMARNGLTIGVYNYTTTVPGGYWVKRDGVIRARFEWDGKAYRKEER